MAESQNEELECVAAHISFLVVGSAFLFECRKALFGGLTDRLVTTRERRNCLTCVYFCDTDLIFQDKMCRIQGS